MQFIMSTESSLGLLTHIRIWHDNRGRGEKASWYLSKIVVTDLHEQYRYSKNSRFRTYKWVHLRGDTTFTKCFPGGQSPF